jgi:hypothetical protein
VLLRADRRRAVERLRCELACQGFDLACEFALLGGQLQHPWRDRAECEQAAAQLEVVATT